MNWKNQRENAYPSIILSDCFVDEIQINNNEIIFKFLTCGFVIKENSRYYHTKSALLIFEHCDIENISIQIIYIKKGLFGNKRIIQDVDMAAFLDNILIGKWKYEIVEEYYSAMGGLFVGRIKTAKAKIWCGIKMQFQSIKYLWDEVDYEAQVW